MEGAPPAHAAYQVVIPQEGLSVASGDLTALIEMHQPPRWAGATISSTGR